MIIKLKNKDTLIIDDFKLKCCIGKNGIINNKIEGDLCTPRGQFRLGSIYYRPDRVSKPTTSLKIKKIRMNMGWCNQSNHKKYNKQIFISKKIKHEKLFRKDHKYDYVIIIEYNTKKTIPKKGSAIFIHLTNNYKPTAGCVALKENDFLVLTKILNKKSTININ